MGASLLITLREGLEAALIVSIVLAYLARLGRREQFRPIWLGTGLAVLFSLAAGAAIFWTVGVIWAMCDRPVGFLPPSHGSAFAEDSSLAGWGKPPAASMGKWKGGLAQFREGLVSNNPLCPELSQFRRAIAEETAVNFLIVLPQ